MPFQPPPRPPSVVASALAAAGIMLAAAGCGHITPLGPGPTPVPMPPARHLGSPLIVQVMARRNPTAAGQCPAGSVSLAPGAGPVAGPAPIKGSSGPSAPPAPSGPPPPASCYGPVSAPVTITSAAVSSVFAYRPTTPAGQPTAPRLYALVVTVPAAEVAAVEAVITQAYNSGDTVGISAAGQLWQAPRVLTPFPAQQLEIAFPSRNPALRLRHILVPTA
jgi:hypothetical protein